MALRKSNVYELKASSYRSLSEWIKKNKDYSETNEWGCHELTALFYKVVLLAKKRLHLAGKSHRNHKEIIESLHEIDENLSAIYHQLFSISRKIRYEALEVPKMVRGIFLELYRKFLENIDKSSREF
jgi:hypothetical protein